jgi:hypothetical protein
MSAAINGCDQTEIVRVSVGDVPQDIIDIWPDRSGENGEIKTSVLRSTCADGDQPTPARTDTEALIRQYLEEMRNQVRLDVRQAVEEYVAKLPLDAPGEEAVVVTGEGTSFSYEPRRRDWGYAVHGMAFTMAGNDSAQGGDWLKLAFWCYLEAAALDPEEVEHLSNVGFHLNLRGEFADAKNVLLYARSFDENNVSVADNLAYAHEHLDEWGCAIRELRDSVLGSGLMDADAVSRLADAFREAGDPDRANDFDQLLDEGTEFIAPTPGLLSAESFEAINQCFVVWDDGDYGTRYVQARSNLDQILAQWCGNGSPVPDNTQLTIQSNMFACFEMADDQASSKIEDQALRCECELRARSSHLGHDIALAQRNVAIYREEFLARERVTQDYRADLVAVVNANTAIPAAERAEVTRQCEMLADIQAMASYSGLINGIEFSESCVQYQREAVQTQQQLCNNFADLLELAPEYDATFIPVSINIGIVMVELESNGTVRLTIGQGIQVFGEVNLITQQYALGGGLGVSFGAIAGSNLVTTQAYFKVRPGESVELGAKFNLRTPTGTVGTGGDVANPKVVFYRNAQSELPASISR